MTFLAEPGSLTLAEVQRNYRDHVADARYQMRHGTKYGQEAR